MVCCFFVPKMEVRDMEKRNIVKIAGAEFSYSEDKEYEKDGHVYCKKCHEQIDGKPIDLFNKKMIFRVSCACDRKKKKLEGEKQRAIEVDRLKKTCFIEQNR